MTNSQKERVAYMRREGHSYTEIAKQLNLTSSVVKSYCVRHGIKKGYDCTETKCEYCGVSIIQSRGVKHKRFCSDRCRNRWWNERPNLISRKAFYEHKCQHCGRVFVAYGNAHRKYCNQDCYIQERFYAVQ